MKLRVAVAAFLLLTTCVHAGAVAPVGPHYVPVIRFDAVVDENSVGQAIEAIEAVKEAKASAIIIEWNTPGGSIDAGMKLAKVIEDSEVPVICVVDGEAASMGAYLLQSCHVRMMTKRSLLMFHQPSISGGGIGGNKETFQNLANILKALESSLVEHWVARMNISAEEMLKKISGGLEWWMNWREARETGAIDCAVKSVKEVADSYRSQLLPPSHCG